MKKTYTTLLAVAILAFASCSKMDNSANRPSGTEGTTVNPDALTAAATAIPTNPNNKIAYYAFDATPTGSPVVNLPLTNFANNANEVVLFEGTAWEMADSVHYGSSSSYILTVNPH